MYSATIPLLSIIPSSIACLSCLWLFFYYFKAKNKSIESSMVFTLGVSDFIYSLMNLAKQGLPSIDDAPFIIIQFFALYFSIYWASAIAFMVYKSLKEMHLNSRRLFSQCFGCVLIFSVFFALM